MSPNKKSNARINRRMQATVIDFVTGFFLFTLIFIINYYAWENINNKLSNTEERHYLETTINQAINSLIKQPGEPINWENNISEMQSIGLAVKDNVLSSEKLSKLQELDYETYQDYILLSGDYRIMITQNDNVIYEIGTTPAGSVVRAERIVKINNSYYKFIFEGWTP